MTDKPKRKNINPDAQELLAENIDLRDRLKQARDEMYKILDSNDELRRKLTRRRNLLSPEYRWQRHWSNGHVSASTAVEAREETIRYFAGQALGACITVTNSGDQPSIHKAAALMGFRLWDELEAAFEAERAERKAAEPEHETEATDDQSNA